MASRSLRSVSCQFGTAIGVEQAHVHEQTLDGLEMPGFWSGTSLASCRGLPARG